MKISELQQLLEMAKEKYGDLEVELMKNIGIYGVQYLPVNKAKVVRRGQGESIEIGEPLSELGKPILHLMHIAPEDEEEDDNQ